VTASVWAFAGMASGHKVSFPFVDVLKTAAAGGVAWLVTWELAGDAHDLMRLAIAATVGGSAFVLACVPLGLLGPREWEIVTSSTRRLLGMWAPDAVR
jgi:hypothetical protein